MYIQQNMSDHADEGIYKKKEIKRKEGVSESDIMMQSECSHEIESSTINYVDYNDPGNWPDYCNNFCQILLQKPPHQIITYNFPKDSKN